MAAAAEVDRALAPAAGTCSWAQIGRLVEEALARHDPAEAEDRRRRAADGRRFDVETDLVDTAGTVLVSGCLDLADALDLEAAVSRTATQLAELGSTDSLDVRRSIAVGEIARQQLALDLETGEIQTGRGRAVVLNVHLTEAAIAGVGGNVARCGNTRTPVLLDQVRDWCQTAGQITVVPIRDLAAHHHVEAYEIPDRIKTQTELLNHTCVFPHCTRRAESLRPRPHRPPRSGRERRGDLLPQHRPTLQTTPPRQDPRTMALPTHPPHRLRVDHPARLPHPPRPPRHPPRDPARPRARRNLTNPLRAPAYPRPRRGHRRARTHRPQPGRSATGCRRPRIGHQPQPARRNHCGLVPNRRPKAAFTAVWSQTDALMVTATPTGHPPSEPGETAVVDRAGPCAAVPATPPRQRPTAEALPTHPLHRLRVDHPARLPQPPRPPRHPPRDPARRPTRRRGLTSTGRRGHRHADRRRQPWLPVEW